MYQPSPERIAELKEIMKRKYNVEYSDSEAEEAARNLLGLAEVLVKCAYEDSLRQKRLEKEPNGFELDGEGRNCFLCRSYAFGQNKMWFDKWGFKCFDCQEAYKKGIVPGYVFKDHDNNKHATDSILSSKFDIHIQTIRKIARQGKLKARVIPKNGTHVFLRKENPDLVAILETERKTKEN